MNTLRILPATAFPSDLPRPGRVHDQIHAGMPLELRQEWTGSGDPSNRLRDLHAMPFLPDRYEHQLRVDCSVGEVEVGRIIVKQRLQPLHKPAHTRLDNDLLFERLQRLSERVIVSVASVIDGRLQIVEHGVVGVPVPLRRQKIDLQTHGAQLRPMTQ